MNNNNTNNNKIYLKNVQLLQNQFGIANLTLGLLSYRLLYVAIRLDLYIKLDFTYIYTLDFTNIRTLHTYIHITKLDYKILARTAKLQEKIGQILQRY